jgi:hypothetical protein
MRPEKDVPMTSAPKDRLLSIELERHLALDHTATGTGFGARPYGCATPFQLQTVLRELLARGWEGVRDPVTGALATVVAPGEQRDVSTALSCSSDVTSGIFETTTNPATDVDGLHRQQQRLDAFLEPLLREHGLFLWSTETPPVTPVDREHYALYHTYWRGEYQLRRGRAEDHYWFSHTIGNNPCVDVTVAEAVPFLNTVLRLTGATLFFRRLGSITGGGPDPAGRLTVRPDAYHGLWRRSPYAADSFRSRMLGRHFTGWADYLRSLMELPITLLVDGGVPHRVDGDPPFAEMFHGSRREGWRLRGYHGRARTVAGAGLEHLSGLQRQVLFSRLRWTIEPGAAKEDLAQCLRHDDDAATEDFFREHVGKCYLEIRSDACPPPGEECVTLAMYLGWLENLEAVHATVVERDDPELWGDLFAAARTSGLDTKVAGHWVPDLLGNLLDLAEAGLARRGRGEDRYLRPLRRRLGQLTSPAEEALAAHAEGGIEAVVALHRVRSDAAFDPGSRPAAAQPAASQ